jgi:C-terminal processing protease CtpA/Prc
MPKDLQMKEMRRKERCYEIQMPVPKKIISFSYFLCFAFLLTSCTTSKYNSYNPASKIAASKLKEDFAVLKEILEANHPSLYWYTQKDSVDYYFNETMESINDSITELEFKNKVAWFVSKIKCGHTSVRPSDAYEEYMSIHRTPRFPLLIKSWNDSLVLLGSFNKQDTLLKRGTVITSIENYNNRMLLDSMFRFISTDGNGNNFKSQAVSANFPLYYSFAFPLKDSFSIHYIDTSGNEKQTYVLLNKSVKNTSKEMKKQEEDFPRPSRNEIKKFILASKRNISYDYENNIAYMRLATFSGGNLRSFFRNTFEELHEKKINNLVIDLRENSGGSINMDILLTRYLKDKPFHVADTAVAVNRNISYSEYIRPCFPYRMAMKFATSKKEDGKYHFRQLEDHKYKPFSNDHFNDHIYIIQGGYTFSAAAMFVLQLKGQQNVTIVGEETGGGNYGTSAVHLPDIILPNSKVRVVLPLYRLVFDSTQIKNEQGIQPDVYVAPSSVDIRNGIDPKMKKIKELIQEQSKKK